ncbi:MAG TPA: DUF4167 domain-containing protein [Erythrobacter sp.]|nr:DUF4167 domain-containing protein [Erythrobacter sp.]
MNNNNNNRNNRRRGRGNRNQGGNGAQLNRIDSRARGNAPQMLDKYKKLAQDAHHNGDRVQMEYYLQFADHYFRVIADNKARVDEQRGAPRRGDDRDSAEEFGDDDIDFGSGRRNEQPTRSRYEQQDSPSRSDQNEGEQGQEGESFLSDDRDDDRGGDGSRDRSDQQPRQQNTRRQPRKPRDGERSGDRETARPERAERPERSEKRPERAEAKPAPRARKPRKLADDDRAKDMGGIDSSILPPSIRSDDSGSSSGDSDGTLETVG